MADEKDWRLTGFEDNLYDKIWFHRHYIEQGLPHDHDHCLLCWEKLMRKNQLAYCSTDYQSWLCEQCFADFQEKFRWKAVKEPPGNAHP